MLERERRKRGRQKKERRRLQKRDGGGNNKRNQEPGAPCPPVRALLALPGDRLYAVFFG
jgi:hypothetical protein